MQLLIFSALTEFLQNAELLKLSSRFFFDKSTKSVIFPRRDLYKNYTKTCMICNIKQRYFSVY